MMKYRDKNIAMIQKNHLNNIMMNIKKSLVNQEGNDGELYVKVKVSSKNKKPSLYKVVILNDDYTPMDFVIDILIRFFNKSKEEAIDIMLHVHKKGLGVCGVYTWEIAETKVVQVLSLAKERQHPLQCKVEKE